MTTITVELPDDLAKRVDEAGLLNSSAIAELIALAMERLEPDPRYFEQEVGASLLQADSPGAQWFTQAEVMAEWASDRAAILAGKPRPTNNG